MEVLIVVAMVLFIVGILIVPAPTSRVIETRSSSFMDDVRRKFNEDGWVNANCSF